MSLGKKDPSYLEGIKHRRDEFGEIARAVSKFFEQPVELKSENIVRRTI